MHHIFFFITTAFTFETFCCSIYLSTVILHKLFFTSLLHWGVATCSCVKTRKKQVKAVFTGFSATVSITRESDKWQRCTTLTLREVLTEFKAANAWRFPVKWLSASVTQHYFLVVFGHDGQKPLELRSEEESDCNEWVECIQQAR